MVGQQQHVWLAVFCSVVCSRYCLDIQLPLRTGSCAHSSWDQYWLLLLLLYLVQAAALAAAGNQQETALRAQMADLQVKLAEQKDVAAEASGRAEQLEEDLAGLRAEVAQVGYDHWSGDELGEQQQQQCGWCIVLYVREHEAKGRWFHRSAAALITLTGMLTLFCGERGVGCLLLHIRFSNDVMESAGRMQVLPGCGNHL